MTRDQEQAVIKEYLDAREDGEDALADRIWRANPDLQDQMLAERLKVKKWC